MNFRIIRNSILSAATAVALLSVMNSCTDNFENINRDPNSPTQASVSLLLNAQLRTIVFNQFDYSSGALLAHEIAKTNYNEIAQYSFGTEESLWSQLYRNIININDIITIAQRNNQPSSEAVGYILKAFCASQLTDHWGNVPFSEAAQGGRNIYPRYDSQEEIYTGENGIISLLRKADELLEMNADQLPQDIVYNGDRAKWRKLANSLRLRYLVRISNRIAQVSSIDIKSQIADCMNKPLMESNDDNFRLQYLSDASNRCPIFNLRSGEFEVIRMSKEIADVMNSTEDPRREVWFQPTENSVAAGSPKYEGVPNGCSSTTLLNLGIKQNNLSLLGTIFTKADAASAVLMNSAEVQFLKAEVIARKWTVGSIEDCYNKGITLSMQQWGVGEDKLSGYLKNSNVIFQTDRGLEMVMREKWLANFMVGYEGWFDFKRTGLPKQTLPLDNRNPGGASKIPSRFYYPESEQTVNKAQYEAAVKIQGGTDNINTKLWWE